jgi:uncharacterized protein with GYD domain
MEGQGGIMPRYIQLMNFTDQGIRTIRDWPARLQAIGQTGAVGTDRGVYLTMGQHDLVRIVEFESDEACAAGTLMLGSAGNVRTTTLRAFTQEEALAIVATIPGT